MNKICLTLTIALALASTVQAQDRRGGPPASPFSFALMDALDANKDGKISTAEIENAVTALKTLDKDEDGKLSSKEIGWPPAFVRGGTGRGGFGSGRGGPPGGFGRQPARPRRPNPNDRDDQQSSDRRN